MHRVIRKIGSREYEYEEESYRIPGVKNPRKRSRYIGPVVQLLKDLARKKDYIDDVVVDTEAERRAGDAYEAERAVIARNNERLTAPTISLEAIAEISETQSSDHASETPASDTAPGE